MPINRCGVKKTKPLAINLDVDGTLKTESWDTNCATDSIMLGKEYKFKPRPHVIEFVGALGVHGDVIICSKASLRYSKEMIKKLGIEDLITGFMTRDYDGMGDYDRIILIDNDREIANEKKFLLKKHGNVTTVIIDTYKGSDNDHVLMRDLEKIEKLIVA